MKPCKCSAEQAYTTTYQDSADGVETVVCTGCGAQYTEPFNPPQLSEATEEPAPSELPASGALDSD